MHKEITRRVFCTTLLALPFPARAAQPKKDPLLGYLSEKEPTSESTRSEGIRLALRERGYMEGQNIAIEYRYAEGKVDRFPELADGLVRLKVDVIVAAGGNRLILALMNATKTIPIIMTGGGNVGSNKQATLTLVLSLLWRARKGEFGVTSIGSA